MGWYRSIPFQRCEQNMGKPFNDYELKGSSVFECTSWEFLLGVLAGHSNWKFLLRVLAESSG